MGQFAIIMNIYLIVTSMLMASQITNKEYCYTDEDKLYSITAYSHYVANQEQFFTWINTTQSYMFNTNQSYWNQSNTTFQYTNDSSKIIKWSYTNGSVI